MDSDIPQTRRSSFLSPAMLASERISVYDSYSFVHHPSAHKVLCLKESQGFLFNQDLFATPYQQSRSAAQERQMTMMRKKRSKSHGHVSFSGGSRPKQRSHSFQPASHSPESVARESFRPDLHGSRSMSHRSFRRPSVSHLQPDQAPDQAPEPWESAMAEDEPMQDADDLRPQRAHSPRRSGRSSISEQFNSTFQKGLLDEGAAFSSSDDEMDIESDAPEYSPIGSNRIPVIDIVVHEDDPLLPESYWRLADIGIKDPAPGCSLPCLVSHDA